MSLICPACDIEIKMSHLDRDDVNDAPRRFGLAWPRAYCPHCGVQVRSNFGALTIYGLIAGVSIVLLGFNWFLEEPYSHFLHAAGLMLLFAAVLIAFRCHRFEAVEQTEPDAAQENTGETPADRGR